MATSKAFGAALAAALIVLAGRVPAHGDTYLLAVEENLNGRKSPMPWPVKEGVYGAMFDAGHIVFDTKDGTALPPLPDLVAMARDGGARYILKVVVTSLDENPKVLKRKVESRAVFDLIDSRTGAVLGHDTATGNNAGREEDVDGRVLGLELGLKIVKEVNGFAKGSAVR
jgi:hypothetical protein